jgi:hypothetical protein
MAAGEDQAQPVIRHLRLGLGLELCGGRCQRLEVRQRLLLHLKDLIAPQPVDRLVARYPRNPRARLIGDPVDRPALECDDERLLDSISGKVEVAQNADQTGDRPSRLVPEQAVNGLMGSLYERVVAPAWVGSS